MKFSLLAILAFFSRCRYKLVGSMEIRDHCEDLGIDGRILLQWIFKK
jgi:hypothetical protein